MTPLIDLNTAMLRTSDKLSAQATSNTVPDPIRIVLLIARSSAIARELPPVQPATYHLCVRRTVARRQPKPPASVQPVACVHGACALTVVTGSSGSSCRQREMAHIPSPSMPQHRVAVSVEAIHAGEHTCLPAYLFASIV